MKKKGKRVSKSEMPNENETAAPLKSNVTLMNPEDSRDSGSSALVTAPESGVLGNFLEQTGNMFKARKMRIQGKLRRIDESGNRLEKLLDKAAEKSEALEVDFIDKLRAQGLTDE
jgi:hypothetical protein